MYNQLDSYIGQMLTYKQLCEVLGLKYYTGGKSKHIQIEDIERYYILNKVKTKYTIVSRREFVLEKQDGRKETSGNNVKYADDIETIMLYTLQNKKEFVCTISQALLLCNLVNKNYKAGKRDIPITSKLLNLNMENVYDFYDTTSRKLKGTFERALDRMRSKAILSYTKPIMVAYNDVQIKMNELGEPKLINGKISYKVSEVHRKATDEEIKIILECEASALDVLKCDDTQRVFLSHKWNEFRSIINEEVTSRLNIKYYYEAYDIVVNTSQVDKKIKKYEKDGSKSILNCTILESLLSSIDKTEHKLDENGARKYDDKYISDMKTMIDIVINSECSYDLQDYIYKVKSGDIVIQENNNDQDEGIPF